MRKPSRIAWSAVVVGVLAVGSISLWANGASAAAPSTTFPSAKGQQTVTSTITVSGTFDGGLKRYVAGGSLGNGGQSESQKAVFEVAPGGTVKNVIIGSPAADGIHCKGTCTLSNVWWEDVGEDAATLLGTAPSGSVMTIDGGGARSASDKVFQHNGPGTMVIKNFYVKTFGKLYRSCGNCKSGYQGKRTVTVQNIIAEGGSAALVGINSNYGDQANLSQITIVGDSSHKLTICQRYTGNNSGKEPTKSGSGPGSGCNYSTSSITYK